MSNQREGMISAMELLAVVSGNEYFEVIKRDGAGKYKNYRVSIEQIRTNVGKSAYESAVENGFRGTEIQWLESLKGKDIYELAVENGFQGSEQDFLESLKGEPGKSNFEIAQENGFQGTEQEFLDSLKGKSAYELAQDNGFQGSEQDFLDSLKGEQGEEGKSVYESAVDNGFQGSLSDFLDSLKGEQGERGEMGPEGPAGASAYEQAQAGGYQGTEQEFIQLLNSLELSLNEPKAISGAIFIRDVIPVNSSDNVGNKTYANDGKTLLSCDSTSLNVKVKFDAITGHTSYKPIITLNDVKIPGLTVKPDNDLIWEGEVTLDNLVPNDQGVGIVTLKHNDGATGQVSITTEAPPVITSATFTGTYPGSQTELKENDEVNIAFSTDVPVIAYEIKDSGALKATTGILTGSNTNYTGTNLKVANRGDTLKSLPFEIRVKKASGAWSAWYSSDTDGNVEFTNVVNLNNARPTVSFDSVTYPSGQTALRSGEVANVLYTVTNEDTVEVTAIGSDVEVVSFGGGVAEVKHVNGEYNDSTQNIEIKATRTANGTSASAMTTIKYATVTPEVSVSVPAARLCSGGNHDTTVQKHLVTLTSTQVLDSAPVLNAPSGNWESAGWVSSNGGRVWTRRLEIHDDDPKGTFEFNGLVAKSASGLEANDIVSGKEYTVGGFVKRWFRVAPFPNREADIGTIVTDVTKLRCTNMSKGQAGSLNTTYKPDIDDQVDTYTILDDNRTWYNCDFPNASSNFSGTMTIELEELV